MRTKLAALLGAALWLATCVVLLTTDRRGVAVSIAVGTVIVASAIAWATAPMRITHCTGGLSGYWVGECRIGGCERPREIGRLSDVIAAMRSHAGRWHQ